MRALSLLAIAASLLPSAHAGIDDTYYPATVHNTLVQQDKYYKDAINVLEDLSTFQSLFVEYHSCTWSASTAFDGNENNGVQKESEEYWYQGAVPLRQANILYSLYGVKKQRNESASSKTSGCTSATFINSYVTTASFQTFTDSMAAAGVDGFVQQQDEDGNSASGNNVCSDDGYGVGCLSGSFVYNSYSHNGNGYYVCDNNHVADIVDQMEALNSNLKATSCYEIFKAEAASSDQDDRNENENGSLPIEAMLKYSQDCRVNDPEIACPDPYGVLKEYELTFRRSAAVSCSRKLKAWGMVGLGLACLLTASMMIFGELKYNRSDGERNNRSRRDFDSVRQKSSSSTNSSTHGMPSANCKGCMVDIPPLKSQPMWSRFRVGRGRNDKPTKSSRKKAAEVELPVLLSDDPGGQTQEEVKKLPVARIPSWLFSSRQSTPVETSRKIAQIKLSSNTSGQFSPFPPHGATVDATRRHRSPLNSEATSLFSISLPFQASASEITESAAAAGGATSSDTILKMGVVDVTNGGLAEMIQSGLDAALFKFDATQCGAVVDEVLDTSDETALIVDELLNTRFDILPKSSESFGCETSSSDSNLSMADTFAPSYFTYSVATLAATSFGHSSTADTYTESNASYTDSTLAADSF